MIWWYLINMNSRKSTLGGDATLRGSRQGRYAEAGELFTVPWTSQGCLLSCFGRCCRETDAASCYFAAFSHGWLEATTWFGILDLALTSTGAAADRSAERLARSTRAVVLLEGHGTYAARDLA